MKEVRFTVKSKRIPEYIRLHKDVIEKIEKMLEGKVPKNNKVRIVFEVKIRPVGFIREKREFIEVG